MKPVPIALLLAAVLLTTHIPLSVCRPRDLSVVDDRGYKKQLDEVLLRVGDNVVSYLLGEKLLQHLQQRKPAAHRSVPLTPPIPAELGLGEGQGFALGLSADTPQRGRWREGEGGSQNELVGFSKRNEEPPISIDLTFHLLRNMIEMARIENQREQAELNRKYLDEVGK
ncbi:urotensin 1 [Salminus brasiliensis]|uniref:urotensin 1 n=1 Tax=Salminus brasiliensis TaxID=930266 RepID=UPI003B836CDE